MITSVTTVSGIAGTLTGEQPQAEVVLRVTGIASTVEDVRKYVEQACAEKAQREVRP